MDAVRSLNTPGHLAVPEKADVRAGGRFVTVLSPARREPVPHPSLCFHPRRRVYGCRTMETTRDGIGKQSAQSSSRRTYDRMVGANDLLVAARSDAHTSEPTALLRT